MQKGYDSGITFKLSLFMSDDRGSSEDVLETLANSNLQATSTGCYRPETRCTVVLDCRKSLKFSIKMIFGK